MRVLLAEDDSVLADGLCRSLRKAGYAIDWVGSGSEADAALTAQPYDLVILDLGLPKLGGMEVLKRLRARETSVPVLILTAADSVEQRVRGLDLGADDFMAKPFALSELELALDAVSAGQRYLSPRISHVLVEAMNAPDTPEPAPGGLTGRQLEVLRCVARGRSNKEIARELSISPKTVEFHRGQLMQRLDIHDVATLTRYAVTAGLV